MNSFHKYMLDASSGPETTSDEEQWLLPEETLHPMGMGITQFQMVITLKETNRAQRQGREAENLFTQVVGEASLDR